MIGCEFTAFDLSATGYKGIRQRRFITGEWIVASIEHQHARSREIHCR